MRDVVGWSDAYSLSSRFGLPGNGADAGGRYGACGGLRPRWWRMPDAVKPEARAEGMRVRFRWSDAYSLSLRFGLPGNGADADIRCGA